ncbi:hypothetical protein ACFP6B_08615 [Rothia nasimurium]|uniref:hypothetical protein n=1 Tax=Rothia nasimurium TaxID=85336 RepID=UPI00361DD768
MTELSSDFQGSSTSRIDFYVPGGLVSIKTSYLVASQIAVLLPMYAMKNPGQFLKISVGRMVDHVLPVATAFSVVHQEVSAVAADAPENLRISEKLTDTLNNGLCLFFDDQGRLLS